MEIILITAIQGCVCLWKLSWSETQARCGNFFAKPNCRIFALVNLHVDRKKNIKLTVNPSVNEKSIEFDKLTEFFMLSFPYKVNDE